VAAVELLDQQQEDQAMLLLASLGTLQLGIYMFQVEAVVVAKLVHMNITI
jgi:hypothetical protein